MVESVRRQTDSRTPSSRRRFLLGSAAVGTAALAGCMGILDLLFDPEDVMLGNNTDQQVRGSVTVTNSDGEVLLDEQFELEPFEDGDNDATEYEDVLQQPGTYSVSVELDDDYAVDGTAQGQQDVNVSDAEEEGILVVFGSDNTDEPIAIDSIEEMSEIDEYLDWD